LPIIKNAVNDESNKKPIRFCFPLDVEGFSSKLTAVGDDKDF
jgi:hypothetical protein